MMITMNLRGARWLPLLAAAFLMVGSLGTANGQAFNVDITVDENGNGRLTNTSGFDSPLPSGMLSDPGPTGLASALTYGLLNPPGLTAGNLGSMSSPARMSPTRSTPSCRSRSAWSCAIRRETFSRVPSCAFRQCRWANR